MRDFPGRRLQGGRERSRDYSMVVNARSGEGREVACAERGNATLLEAECGKVCGQEMMTLDLAWGTFAGGDRSRRNENWHPCDVR